MTRWTRRLLVCAIALLVPALAGCEAGQDAPTLTFHPASNGASTVVNGVSIDHAFVLGSPLSSQLPPGGRAGVFLSLFAQTGDRLVSVSAPGTAAAVRIVGGPVTVPPQRLVHLSGPSPQIVLTGLTNSLSGGQTIQLVFVFSNAGAIPLQVPVEPRAYDYATDLPPTVLTPTATPRGRARPTVSPAVSPPPSPNKSTSPTATP